MSPITPLLLLMTSLSAMANMEITPPQVLTANGTHLSVESTVLQCRSDKNHQFCEWTSPDSKKCLANLCPIQGATVKSDYQSCTLELEHDIRSYETHAGAWSCELFFVYQKSSAVANTHLYIVDLSEMPIIRQSSSKPGSSELATMEFLEAGDTKDVQFQCNADTKAPKKEYQWYLNNQQVSKEEAISLKLTRQDFNSTLKCLVELSVNEHQSIGSIATSETLIFRMNPVIVDILKIKDDNYQIETESWPLPSFVRISIVEGCNNDCVIYKLVNGKYEIDTSPYMKPQSSFVKDVVIQGQVYGAKTRTNIHFNMDKLKDIKVVYIAIGNELNVANAKIDLQAAPHEYRSSSLEKVKLNDMTPLIVGLSVGLICLILAIILMVVFRSRIRQAFQCGSYFIPPPANDEEQANSQDIVDEQKVPLADQQQNGTKTIPPETEF